MNSSVSTLIVKQSHFRFFDHDGNLLGYSAMEVYKVAAGQTSALLSQDDSTVSELKLTSNAFNPGKSDRKSVV